MVDQELRALERDVRTVGSPATRLRLAAALERSVQHSRDDVLSVLLPARDDVAVRERIGRLGPTWISPEFSCHTAHFVDVEPLRVRPRLRWTRRLAPESPTLRSMLLASPLGIVCTPRATETLQVLDPESGSLRWESAWPSLHRPRPGDPVGYTPRWPEIVQSTLAMWEPPEFVCRDLWTGQELHRTALGEQFAQVRVAAGHLVAWGEHDLVALRYADPRLPPDPAPAWCLSRVFEAGFALHPHAVLQFGEDLVVGSYSRPRRSAVVSIATGEVRAEVPVAFHKADEHGLVGHVDDVDALYGRPTAPPLRSCGGAVLGMSPSLVVIARREALPGEHQRERVILESREDGGRLGVLVDGLADYGALAVARDVVYEFTWRLPEAFLRFDAPPAAPPPSTLRAHDRTGAVVWELPHDVLASAVMGVAPLHGRRLYGLTQDGAVFCLEEDVDSPSPTGTGSSTSWARPKERPPGSRPT